MALHEQHASVVGCLFVRHQKVRSGDFRIARFFVEVRCERGDGEGEEGGREGGDRHAGVGVESYVCVRGGRGGGKKDQAGGGVLEGGVGIVEDGGEDLVFESAGTLQAGESGEL